MIIAYIDPGVGALILQSAIAVAAGAIIFFRQKIAGLWTRFIKTKQDK